jgi:hypothetical protein
VAWNIISHEEEILKLVRANLFLDNKNPFRGAKVNLTDQSSWRNQDPLSSEVVSGNTSVY